MAPPNLSLRSTSMDEKFILAIIQIKIKSPNLIKYTLNTTIKRYQLAHKILHRMAHINGRNTRSNRQL